MSFAIYGKCKRCGSLTGNGRCWMCFEVDAQALDLVRMLAQARQPAAMVETCNRCQSPLMAESVPPFGWELESGEKVCHQCCVEDTKGVLSMLIKEAP